MPDDSQGPYKCGKTGGDAKKRAKEMQTGNHNEMRVVASAKCIDSKLIEDVMHRIFHDYRTNDKLEWFDAPLDSMKSVMSFMVECIDGLNRVDHDQVSIKLHLDDIITSIKTAPFTFRQNSVEEESQDISTEHENNVYSLFCEQFVRRTRKDDDYFTIGDVKGKWPAFAAWMVATGHASRLLPIPKLSDLKSGLSSHLNIPCQKVKKIPRKRSNAKSAFFLAVLRSSPRDNTCSH